MRRRAFLAASAATLTVTLPGCTWLPVIPKRPAPSRADAAGWIRVRGGRYTLHLPRVDMGQNIGTALRQVACTELGVAPGDVVVVPLSTAAQARVRATVGSDSIKDYMLPLAQACATLREALAQGRTEGWLEARDIPATQLRAFSRRRAARPGAGACEVGAPAPIEAADAIVTGRPLYAGDVRLDGMVFARVLRAPVTPELASAPRRMDEAAARRVPGFVALVRDPALRHGSSEGVGIVARTPGALDRMAAALDVQWQVAGEAPPAAIDRLIDVDAHLARGALAHVPRDDGPDTGGPWSVDLRLDVPMAAHAGIEPRCAVAQPQDGPVRMVVWAGTQDPFYVRDVIARRLGWDEQEVAVQACRVGGAFGGRTLCTVELEAAVLARAVGRPVKVTWTRAQEFQLGFHRPPSSHRVRLRLEDGRITDWWHALVSSHILFTPAGMPPWMQRVADLAGDGGVARGSRLAYAVPRQRVEFSAVRLAVHTGPWRGLGAGPNVLAVESAVDEAARAAGRDAVAFRLDHIDDGRLAGVLRLAAADARWGQPLTAGGRRGRGVACGIYKAMSYAAVVAEVEVDSVTGRVRVTGLWCAHDCGLVVNPQQVRAQTEGNLVWCLGMVLVERLPLDGTGVAATSFADYAIPRYGEVPPLHVSLVDSAGPPTGAGETAMVAGAAAIANAVRDAVGVRPLRFPIDPQWVRDALAGRSPVPVSSPPSSPGV